MISLEGRRLIVFGCGYIGGEIARQAIRRGAQVTALTRNPQTAERLKGEGVETVVADFASDAWHGQMPGGSDYVLNAVSSGGGGVSGYRSSYVGGMQSLLKWAAGTQPMGTLVYTSSTSVYPQDGGALVDESASTDGVGELPQILLEAEKFVRGCGPVDAQRVRPGENRPVGFARCFILRLAGIYGPGRHHLVEQVRSGTVAGRGDHHLNLAHRDDIVRAIWAAFEAAADVAGGVFNVADDTPTLKREIVAWLAQQLGVPAPVFSGAPAAGRRAVTPDRLIVNAKLKSVLGWKLCYPTFREGYKNMLALRSE
jgi:nucleoside-diphosphate-sugar epimerase